MLDLGTVRPGSTLRIPFSSFDKDDGSSITMTGYAVGDILVYKDGGTTERASTAGFTATTDFDAKTGKHVAVIDLADNTTAGFFAAGSEYLVAIDAVTVDAVTTGGWIARFRIGYPSAILDTTIATLSSQTSFTLTDGPAEDDALNGMWVVIHDVASRLQWAWVQISDYVGSTKTVTLVAGATFTVAASDNVSVMGPTSGYSLSAAGVQAIWDALTSALTTAGSIGKLLVDNINATISSRASSSELTSQTDAIDAALVTIDDFLDTEIAAIISTLGTPAGASLAVDIADVEGKVDDLEARLTAALADKLTKHAAAVLAMVVGSGSTTTTIKLSTVEGGSPSAVDDFYNGRVIIFTSGALAGQAVEITDYTGATTTATVTAATSAPANNDVAVIV